MCIRDRSGTSVSSALSGEIQCSATATFGTETCTVSAFGIPIQLNDYSGNIFVPLLMAAVLAVVYRGLKRVIPDSVQPVSYTHLDVYKRQTCCCGVCLILHAVRLRCLVVMDFVND